MTYQRTSIWASTAIPLLGFIHGGLPCAAGTAPSAPLSTTLAASPALPTAGQVVAGQAKISSTIPSALTIYQSSNRAVIDWNSFSIGPSDGVTFVQPTSSAAVLNRVTGGTTSTIAGNLSGNGQIFLINPNGISITRTGDVQVGGGFVASTLDMLPTDFMANGFDLVTSGAPASVVNAGTIAAREGGVVVLAGATVANSGTIEVPLGKVVLASGARATLNLGGDGLLQVMAPAGATTTSGQPLIDQSGKILANGGSVQLTADTVAQAQREAVYVSGSISAHSVSGHEGLIVIGGGPGGTVTLDGNLSTSGEGGARGGIIIASGRVLGVGPAGRLDASGAVGGTVLLGGERQGGADPAGDLSAIPVANAQDTQIAAGALIDANGSMGRGGNVVVWSNEHTDFAGTIDATGANGTSGGAVEVSSHGRLGYSGEVDVLSVGGRTGTLLLDPYNVTISTGTDSNYNTSSFTATGNNSVINAATLDTALASANVTLSTGSSGSQAGTVTVANPLFWTSGNTLTLSAASTIAINANITATTGALTLTAGASSAAVSANGNINVGAFSLTQGAWVQNTPSLPSFYAGNFTIGSSASFLRTAGGSGTSASPYLIADVYGLQGIGTSATYLGNSYSLTNDVDASVTSGWNSNAGFVPLGAYGSTGYSGTFNGQGHSILNLDINRGTLGTGVGLFGYAHNATIENVSLLNATVTGESVSGTEYTGTGALIGLVDGTSSISNTTTTGSVTGSGSAGADSGGLIGSAQGTLTLNNSSSAANVNGGSGSSVGGLIGGLTATMTGSSLSAVGSVSTTGNNAGGLIGFLGSGNTISISNAYASGSVSGNSDVGGLIGYFSNNSATLSNTYAAGAVSGSTNLGGWVGYKFYGTASGSYWDTTTSGQSGGGTTTGVTGEATAALHTQSTFSGWDFANTWYLTSGYYPTLRNGTTVLGKAGGNLTVSTSADSTTNFNTASLQNLLSAGSVLVSTTNGTLTVSSPVTWSSSGSLALASSGALNVGSGANLTGTGTGNLGIYALSGTATGAAATVTGATLSTASGNLSLAAPNAGSNVALTLNGGTLSVGAGIGTLLGNSTSANGLVASGAVSLTAGVGSLSVGARASSGYAIEFAPNASLSTSGTVLVSGVSATGLGMNFSGPNTVSTSSGALTLNGTSSTDIGTYVSSADNLTASGGSISLAGTALAPTVAFGGGLNLSGDSSLTTAGSVTLTGTGPGPSGRHGIVLQSGASVTNTSGSLTLNGFAQGASNSYGVYFVGGNTLTDSAGTLTVSGTGVGNVGVNLLGTNTLANTGNGTFSLAGISNTSTGLLLNTAAALTASGTINVTGTSSSGQGVVMNGSNTVTNSGSLTVSGITGSGTNGLSFIGATMLTNNGSTLIFSGNASSASSYPISIGSGASVALSGSGGATFADASTSSATTAFYDQGVLSSSGGTLLIAPASAHNISIATGAVVTATGFGGISMSTVGSGSLTNAGTISIGTNGTGSINLGTVNGTLTNAGTVSGSATAGSVELLTNGSGAINDAAGVLTQAGLGAISIQTSGTGSIAADRITYSNAATDSLTVSGAGNITLGNPITTSGGPLNTTVSATAGMITLSSSLMTGGGSLSVSSLGNTGGSGTEAVYLNGASVNVGAGTANIAGTSTNTGTGIVIAGADSVTDTATALTLNGTSLSTGVGLNFNTAATLTNNGSVTLTGTSHGNRGAQFAGSNTLTDSSGALSLFGVDPIGTGVVIHGNVNFNGSGTGISINGTSQSYGINVTSADSVTTSGTVSLSGTSTATSSGGGKGFSLSSSDVLTNNAGSLTVAGTANSAGYGLYASTAGSITINNNGGSTSLTGTSANNYGVYLDAGDTLATSGAISLTGRSSATSGVYFVGGNTINNSGALSLIGSTSGNGQIGVEFAGTTTLVNTGSGFTVSGSSSVASGMGIQVDSGQTVTSSGILEFTDTMGSLAPTAISIAGTLQSGSSGSLTLAPTSANNISIATGGVLTSTGSGSLIVMANGAGAISNSGTISQGTGGSGGITLATVNGTLTNAGTIAGSSTSGALVLQTSGTGAIADAAGTITQAGVGAISLQSAGSGSISTDAISYSGSAANVLTVSSAGNLTVANSIGSSGGPFSETLTSGGSLTIAPGSSVSGASPVLSAANAFVNNAGSGALVATSGSWLVYSTAPNADTFGGLNSNNTALWNATYATSPPSSVTQSGNLYLFAYQPTLTVNSVNASKMYGVDGTSAVAADFTVTGYQAGVNGVFLSDSAASTVSGAPSVTSAGAAAAATVAGSPYAISTDTGSLIAISGYALAFQSSGALTVNPAPLTITAANQSKTYGATAMLGNTAFNETGLVNGDTVSSVTLSSSGIASTAPVAGGPYSIVPSAATGIGLSNYTIAYLNGQLTVNPAPITVTALGGSSTYGISPTNPGLSASGLQNNESVSVLTGLSNSFGITNTSNAGSYTLNVAGTLTDPNYTLLNTNTGAWNVGPASLTITAGNQSKTYGATASLGSTAFTESGLLNSDSISGVTLNSAGAAATATVAGGPYSIVPSAAIGTGLSNYAISYLNGQLSINPAPLTVTALGGSSTYGTIPTNPGLSASGLQNGESVSVLTGLSNSFGISTSSNVGNYSLSVAGALTNSNYTISGTNSGTWTVSPATLTITASNQSKTYGATPSLGTSALSETGLLNSDSISGVTLTSAGAAATATVAGGPYSILPSAATGTGLSNYTISYLTGQLTVNPAPITVTALGGSSIYGGSPMNPGLSASGLQNGESANVLTGLSNSFGINPTSNVSAYTLYVVGSLTNSNYTVSSISSGAWTVNPASLTITAGNQSKTYGVTANLGTTVFSETGLTNSDTVNGVTLTSTGAAPTASVAAGPYAIMPSGATGTGLSNYTITYVNGELTVNPALITVSALGGSSTYGMSPTNPGLSASGLQNGESVSALTGLLNSFGMTNTSNVGNYTLNVAGALTNPNYAVSSTHPGSWNVNPASLTITASDQSKIYGAAINLGSTAFSEAGLFNGDTISGIVLTSAGATAVATVAGGPYPIVPSGATGTGVSNYTITYVNGLLTVTPAALSITALDQSKIYGAAANLGSAAFSANGLLNSDSISGVTLTSTGTAPSAGVAGGPYPIVPSSAIGTGLANYAITFVNGQLTVSPAPLTITALNQSKTYGSLANLGTTDFAETGLLNADSITGVTLTSGGAAALASVMGGPYSLAPSTAVGSGLSNYNVTYINGTLTVKPAPVVVTALGGSSTFGTVPRNPGLSAVGLQNGQSVTALSGLDSSFDLTAVSNVGSYALYVTGKLTNPNYVVSGVHTNTWVITPLQAESQWMAGQVMLTPMLFGRLCVDEDGPYYRRELEISEQAVWCTR